MDESTATEFYDRIVQGTDYERTIAIGDDTGRELEGVKMRPVSKRVLADVIQKLPDEMFDAVESAESPEEAEEMLGDSEGGGMSITSLNSDTIEAFERLCQESLSHPQLTPTQMNQIIENFDFERLFQIGGEVMDMSFAEGSAIKDFREQE